MKGGSQVGFPILVKKFVHCVAVTWIKVPTVGCGVAGFVVEGNHAKIWSANALGTVTKMIVESIGTSDDTDGVMVTVAAALFTPLTTVPVAIFGPETDIPLAIPTVAPAPKVSVLPDGQSNVVVATMPLKLTVVTLPEAGGTNVTVTVDPLLFMLTALTTVPGAILVPLTVIPTPIPIAVPSEFVAANVSVAGVGAPVAVAVKGGMM